MNIHDLIKENSNRRYVGSKASSRESLDIYRLQVSLRVAGVFADLLGRGVAALEALAKQAGAELPDNSERARKAEARARARAQAEKLKAQAAELEAQAEGDDEEDDAPSE